MCISFFGILNVNAQEATFYEAEYLDNIYISKYEYSTGITHYLHSQFIRKTDTNEFVYCIDPFILFQGNSIYSTTDNVNNMSQSQINKINKIAHFGYGYKDHTEEKWYAITQLMIWQAANPSIGRYYFTDGLNGNEISIFTDEINEINRLIREYDNTIYLNDTYYMLEGSSIGITAGPSINYYESPSDNVIIGNNKISIRNLTEGEYEYQLVRHENESNKPLLLYTAPNTQALLQRGDIADKELLLKVVVNKSKLIINKVDQDTNDTTPQGEASLDGAIYGIYSKYTDKIIQEVEIVNNQAIIENIKGGEFYLKEIKPGTGYELDEEKYEFKITAQENIVELTLNNKVIDKKVIINKQYGDESSLQPEPNIDFEIYNSKNEVVKTISTDEEGKVETILPYGKYTICQKNTTPGYLKTNPISLVVENNEEEIIKLVDYKIPVPNTHTERNVFLYLLLILLIII